MKRFQEKIGVISQKVIEMGDLTQVMLRGAVKGLFGNDARFLQDVYEQEDRVNGLEKEIDEDCVTALALFQPEAHDLRFIASVMRANGDIERMGDHAINISHRIREAASYMLPLDVRERFEELAETAIGMAGDSVRAMISRNSGVAQDVLAREERADELKDEIARMLLEYSRQGERDFEKPLHFILTARDLERVADLATNIAEDVIYMEQGKDIRHRRRDTPTGGE